MKVFICGDKEWTNTVLALRVLRILFINGYETVIVEGNNTELFRKCALQVGMKEGNGNPDLVVAFHNDIKNSVVIKDLLKHANDAGVNWYLIGDETATWETGEKIAL